MGKGVAGYGEGGRKLRVEQTLPDEQPLTRVLVSG